MHSAAEIHQKPDDYKAAYHQLSIEYKELKTQLEWFKKQLFGEKSEKRSILPEGIEQSSLFDDQSAPDTPEDQRPDQQISYTRKKGKKDREDSVTDSGLRFGETVPVERIEIPSPELNGEDADQYEVIGEKTLHRLAQRPGSYVVLEYTTPVVKPKVFEGEIDIITAPFPATVFEGTIADVSLLAGMLVDKFIYHLPLYRQHQRMTQEGIKLSRATLTHWFHRTIPLLKPIYQAQLQNILQSKVLAMDETPIKAGRKSKGKMQQAWYWPIYGQDHEIAFTFSTSRGSDHIKQSLKGFEGTLLSDGYAGYDRYARQINQNQSDPIITQAQCWTHTRRYFVKAEDAEPEAVAEALEQIGLLYKHEKEIRKLKEQEEKRRQKDPDALRAKILKIRSEKSHPVVECFFEWCYQQRQRTDLVNSNPLSKALVYTQNHQQQLKTYLSDPDVPIDTNHLERALRVIPMGRKNWLFNWTEVGAEYVGIIQSLLTTCRLHDINPYTYLTDVLQRVAQHPASKVEELTPRVWKMKFAKDPLQSDLSGFGKNGLV